MNVSFEGKSLIRRKEEIAIEDQLLEDFRHLRPDQRKTVLDFVHFLRQRQETSHETDLEFAEESAFDLAERLGLIGVFEGPGDLSYNKAYFEDFGQ